MIEITSMQNQRIKDVVKLRNRRERERTDLFIIEGYRELLRAVNGGWKIEQLYVCEPLFLGTNEKELIEKAGGELFLCPEAVFRKISYRDRPDGLLAIAFQRHRKVDELSSSKNPLYIVAEAIEKPGNLGTILRSADASSVDGCVVCDQCTDLFNPNVVRASVGTLFSVPCVEGSSRETLAWLKKQGIAVLAATPSAELVYTEVDMCQPLAIVVGTEQLGLSDLWMEEATLRVKIPMLGVADSLNVAMATTLLLYEAVRQRHG